MDGMSETFVPIVFVGHFGADSTVVNSAHVAGLAIVAACVGQPYLYSSVMLYC